MSDISKSLVAVLSLPRFGPLDPMLDLMRTIQKLGIRFVKEGGAYYGQAMTRGMQRAMKEDGCTSILTIDYDTPHDLEDVLALYGMLKMRDDIDAICPLQMRRECDEALICARDPQTGKLMPTLPGELFTTELAKMARGHFGLTIIRASALRDVPKPWFMPTPDADGEWGAGHIDDDVHFWDNWHRAGKSLYCAHTVPVAHLQIMKTWPGADFRPLHQALTDFELHGKPSGVWSEDE